MAFGLRGFTAWAEWGGTDSQFMKHVLVEAIVFCSQPEDDALVSSGESVQVIFQGERGGGGWWSVDCFDESLYFSVADAVVSLGG